MKKLKSDTKFAAFRRHTRWLINTVVYKLFPSRCKQCRRPVVGSMYSYTHKHNKHGKRVILQGHTMFQCDHCLAEEIRRTFQNQSIPINECCSCGEWKPCDVNMLSYGGKFTYGSHWWNGWHVCEECLLDTIENQSPSTRVGVICWNGQHYMINSRGAVVDVPLRVVFKRWYAELKSLRS